MPASLTNRERLMRIIQGGKDIDRPALKLWGLEPCQEAVNEQYASSAINHKAYEQVTKLALETTDIFGQLSINVHSHCGILEKECVYEYDEPCEIPNWRQVRTVMKTPLGDLTSLRRVSTIGEPEYKLEYFVKEPDDVRKLLSAPYEPYPFDPTRFNAIDAAVGDRGITILGLPYPGGLLYNACGSEMMALIMMDEPELMDEAINLYTQRAHGLLEDVIRQGLKPVYCVIGPELLIPPLMNMDGFRRYAVESNRKLYARMRESGGHIWMHCHGKTAKLLDDFIGLGVGAINPLEPPPNGDVDMFEIAKKYGGRIALEGNIEIQEIIQAEPEHLRTLMEECVAAGAPTGRFILCPSAGYKEYVFPSERYIQNLMLYLEYGLELVNRKW